MVPYLQLNLGWRFLVRARGYWGLLVSSSSIDVKLYLAGKQGSPWWQHREIVRSVVIPFCLSFWCRVNCEQLDVLGSQQILVNKCSDGSKSFSDMLPWFILWTVNDANDKLNQLHLFSSLILFLFPRQALWDFPLIHQADVLHVKTITTNEESRGRKREKRNKTAPISNPSRVVC